MGLPAYPSHLPCHDHHEPRPAGADLQPYLEQLWGPLALDLGRWILQGIRLLRAKAEPVEPPGFHQPWVNAVSRGAPWRVFHQWRWRREGHINILEQGAERKLAKSLCRSGIEGRVNLLEDSRVTILSNSKGRSSSRAIRAQLGLTLPYAVGGNLYIGRHYTPSALMPADHPSRNRELPPPLAAAPPWFGSDPTGWKEEMIDSWLMVPRCRRPVAEWARLVLLLTLESQVRDSRLWFQGEELGTDYRSNDNGDGPRPGPWQIRPDLPGHRNLSLETVSHRERAVPAHVCSRGLQKPVALPCYRACTRRK